MAIQFLPTTSRPFSVSMTEVELARGTIRLSRLSNTAAGREHLACLRSTSGRHALRILAASSISEGSVGRRCSITHGSPQRGLLSQRTNRKAKNQQAKIVD